MAVLAAAAASGCDSGCNGGSLTGSGGFSGIKRDGGGASGAGGLSGRGAAGSGNLGGFMTTGGGGRSGSPTGDPCADAILRDCPTALCGNGVRDTCVVRQATGLCPAGSVTETCDGADLGAETCRTQHFGSGTLKCTPSCRDLDVRGCSECEAPSADLLRCGLVPMVGTADLAAISATDTEVALAWVVNGTGAAAPRLGFTRLSPSLELVTSVTLAAPTPLGASSLAVAPLPSGWLIAGYAEPNVYAVEIDATGPEVARTEVETVAADRLLAAPVLASRPGGLPLLVWISDRGVRGVVMAGASKPAAAPVDLAPPTSSLSLLDAAWIGNAFYVSMHVETPANPKQLRLLRITPDGKLDTTIDALPGEEIWNARLVRNADDLRILFEGPATIDDQSTWSVSWQRLTATGAPATAAIPLTSSTDYALSAAGVAFGSDTALLSISINDATAAATIARVDAGGQAVRPRFQIARGDRLSDGPADIARRGPDVIALWTINGVPQLARVSP